MVHMTARPRGLTVKRMVAAAVAMVALALCALPFLVDRGVYGKVPIPGSATVHLPAGNVDVTLCFQKPDSDGNATPLPPLSMRMFSLDGRTKPKVVESWATRWWGGGCDIQARVWVVQVACEGDYRVVVDGEVYGPYQPTLAFGDFVWNGFVLALRIAGIAILVLAGSVVASYVWMGILLLPIMGPRWVFGCYQPQSKGSSRGSPGPDLLTLPADVADSPPADLVLPYPKPRARVAGFIYFALGDDVLVGGPALAMYWWLTVPGPTHWPQVVVLGGMAVGFGYMFWRIASRWALIRARRARGDGWLRLTGKGFEVHERSGKPRQYAWSELEDFLLVESQDSEGGVSRHVGIRFTSESKRAGHAINGYWECSLEEAVELMNGWLPRHQLARGLELL
jgi:hypothetical protein